MLRMWVLTVSGDRYRRVAIVLRSSPLTISRSTSRSRSVSWPSGGANGSDSGFSVVASIPASRPAGNQVPPSTAARTAVTTCSAGPSLDTKPIAPAWMAPMAVATSE
jgi:hypothetical protein